MTYELQVGDYVAFSQIVVSAETRVRYMPCPETGRPIAQPLRHEQILPQSGAGQILSIAKSVRKISRRTASGQEKVTKVNTGRVDAGRGLGVVTAVLDNAVLSAKQMDFGMDTLFASEAAGGMYSTDVKDHQ